MGYPPHVDTGEGRPGARPGLLRGLTERSTLTVMAHVAEQGCVIGGVTVDCEYGVEAHSDGDVLYHSLTDAILGAGAGPSSALPLCLRELPKKEAISGVAEMWACADRGGGGGVRPGALTLPDIGQLFPDTDPRWRGCYSEMARRRARARAPPRSRARRDPRRGS